MDTRSRIYRILVTGHITVTVLFVIIVVLVFSIGDVDVKALPSMMLAGVLGSLLSVLRRISLSARLLPNNDFGNEIEADRIFLVALSILPALIGAMSAGILYVAFAAELINGPIFPNFDCVPTKSCATFDLFVENWQPVEGHSFAKLITWGFVAGFSERFVPDLLSRLSKKGGSAKNT